MTELTTVKVCYVRNVLTSVVDSSRLYYIVVVWRYATTDRLTLRRLIKHMVPESFESWRTKHRGKSRDQQRVARYHLYS